MTNRARFRRKIRNNNNFFGRGQRFLSRYRYYMPRYWWPYRYYGNRPTSGLEDVDYDDTQIYYDGDEDGIPDYPRSIEHFGHNKQIEMKCLVAALILYIIIKKY
jgi:hypothetical protein